MWSTNAQPMPHGALDILRPRKLQRTLIQQSSVRSAVRNKIHSRPLCRLHSFGPGYTLNELTRTSNASFAFGVFARYASSAAFKLTDFPPERIRSFAIISHVDHGKSTLSDRLLEATNTISNNASNAQVLDKLKVERERGITVQAQTASMLYTAADKQTYLLNLIDTPGHVDFASEVSRSLLAVQGALLLVDATQGIQAQTLSVLRAATKHTKIGVVNKVDLDISRPQECVAELESLLGVGGGAGGPILQVSAKSGLNIDVLLQRIVDKIPPADGSSSNPLRALVFDNHFDDYRGVVSLVAVKDGRIKKGDKIRFMKADKVFEVADVGILHPDAVSCPEGLQAGQCGWLMCSMKDEKDAHLGDTIHNPRHKVEPLAEFKPLQAMVYAGFYPHDASEFTQLEEAVKRLALTDRAITIARESSAALGQGFRLGFLGSLHLDVVRQRLEDEYSAEVIVTRPFVPLKMVMRDGSEQSINSAAEFPEHSDINVRSRIESIQEPVIEASILSPEEYAGDIMSLCSEFRGVQTSFGYLESDVVHEQRQRRVKLDYILPLSAIVTTFHSSLKSLSSGYASLDYENAGFQPSDLVKLNILVNSKPVDALCTVVHRSNAVQEGKDILVKLKDVVARQQFEVVFQAAIGAKIIARERIAPARKDVTAGLYGGHYERKMKHLAKQKEGKKRLKRFGNVELPTEAFFNVLSVGSTGKKSKR